MSSTEQIKNLILDLSNYNSYIIQNKSVVEKGDWFIELDLNRSRGSYCNKPIFCDIGNTDGFILTKEINYPFPENCMKIIITNDDNLTLNSTKSIRLKSVFIEYCLNRNDCQMISKSVEISNGVLNETYVFKLKENYYLVLVKK